MIPNFCIFAVGCVTSGFTLYVGGELISTKTFEFVKYLDSASCLCH